MGKSRTVLPPGPWLPRLVWLVLPVVLGPALAGALDGRSPAVSGLVQVVAWLGWTAGLVAVLVPRTVGLTGLRTAGPALVVLAGWMVAAADPPGGAEVLALAGSLVVALVLLAPTTADAFVNGSAYGEERRFALRAPAPLLLGPVPVVWALVVAGVVAGPLLVATGRWGLGAVAGVVGFAVAGAGLRSLHQLARRWLVLVPAGLVVHDPLGAQPQLFRRTQIARLGPAPADTDALDLTNRALGLGLELRLREPVDVELRARGRPSRTVATAAVLVTPSRPGAVLAAARERRIPVG